MKIKHTLPLICSLLLSASVLAQGGGVSPQDLLKPLKDSWPTYNGDYTGKRYSSLTAVNRETVKNLGLAWSAQLTSGDESSASGGRRSASPTSRFIVGGEGAGDMNIHSGSIKGSALMVDGTLYVTMPDNAWAIDARSGRTMWHYFWKTRGGTHIGNRGFGMWNGYLYMETPDDYLVSL
ncbi:MAG TPA: acido-empty-quinoprotein group A, partial [Edaphobacter sp.]|nr:acido-empty-quinoprotein group A [Edaphobacter sp.]